MRNIFSLFVLLATTLLLSGLMVSLMACEGMEGEENGPEEESAVNQDWESVYVPSETVGRVHVAYYRDYSPSELVR